MARRSIDMLPLLDVFMVVLFVFATVQESQLDSSSQARSEAEATAAAAAARAEQLAAQLAAATTQRSGEDERTREREAELEAYRDACGPRQPGGPLCPAAELAGDVEAQIEIAALHERLLDNVAVFEIELGGRRVLADDPANDRRLNLCCFRSDPPRGAWQACGEVPAREAELDRWLADGAGGLLDGLRRTRGGNALIQLRQDGQASYRVSNLLAERLRSQLPEHRIYDDSVLGGELRCPQLASPQPQPGSNAAQNRPAEQPARSPAGAD